MDKINYREVKRVPMPNAQNGFTTQAEGLIKWPTTNTLTETEVARNIWGVTV